MHKAIDSTNKITPNVLQKEAISRFHKSVKSGNSRMALIMATATGKTNVSIWCIEEYFKMYGFGRTLFIAHLDQIWQQADERFKQLLPSVSRGFFMGREKININAGVITAGVVSLAQGIKNKTIPFKKDHFDFIVIDEFHHSAASNYKTVLNYFKPKVLLGMSCLKERHDQKDFLQYFGNNIIYEIDTVTAIEQKTIAGLKYYAVKDDIDYRIHRNGYEYRETDQNRKLIIPEKDKRVIEKWKDIAAGKKTMVFCANISHAVRMTEVFNETGVPAVAIHHFNAAYPDMTPKNILQKTEDFRNGKYQVACTIDKWLEGADFPDVEVGLFLRPTKSWRVFIQSRGRVLRLFRGKKYGIIIDAVGNHKWIKIYRNLLQEHMIWMSRRLGKDTSIQDIQEIITKKGNEAFIKKYQEIAKEYEEKIVHREYKYRKSGRPVYDTNKPEIVFEPGVFELHIEEIKDIFYRTGERDITAEHLIADYLELEKRLGRQPTSMEFIKHHHSMYAFVRIFGNPGWRNMLYRIGRKPLEEKGLTAERFVADFFDLEKKLGRQPISGEYAKHHHSIVGLDRVFGKPGWRNMLKSIGRTSRKRGRDITDAHLIADYLELEKQLGRQPSPSEFTKQHHATTILDKIFGRPGWRNMLKRIGRTVGEINITADHLIADYLDLEKKLGRQPTRGEYAKEHHSDSALNRVFGKTGWRMMVKNTGRTMLRERGLTQEHCINDFLELEKQLGRQPASSEYVKHHHCIAVLNRVFDNPGWRNMLKGIGRAMLVEKKISREHLINDFFELEERLNRQPSLTEFKKQHHNNKVLARLFGNPGWRNMLSTIGRQARPAGFQSISSMRKGV